LLRGVPEQTKNACKMKKEKRAASREKNREPSEWLRRGKKKRNFAIVTHANKKGRKRTSQQRERP